MTKYLLADRERNFADDSDFYAIFWNTETNRIESEEYGTTRFANCPRVAPADVYIRPVPQEIIELAIAYSAMRKFTALRMYDYDQVNEPDTANHGDRLTLTKKGTFKDKKTGEKISYAAGDCGTVIWVGNFGTFYGNGYKTRNRSNCRVGLRLDDGRVIFVAMDKCKLARPLTSVESLWSDAINDAHYQARFGWR